jgi:hypothetical protein
MTIHDEVISWGNMIFQGEAAVMHIMIQKCNFVSKIIRETPPNQNHLDD